MRHHYSVCVCGVCIKYTFSQDHIEPYDSFIFCMFVCSFIRLYVVLWKSTLTASIWIKMIRNSQVVLIRCTWLTKQVWPPLKADALSVCWSGPLLKKKKKGGRKKQLSLRKFTPRSRFAMLKQIAKNIRLCNS